MGEGEFTVDLRERDAGRQRPGRGRLPRPSEPGPSIRARRRDGVGRRALSHRARPGGGRAEGETLVFDEIDAGIGGGTAHRVAETLQRLAERAQVITITHLPQIANVAERHFRVEKLPGDPTHTTDRAARRRDRRDELERMLGGKEFLPRSRPAGPGSPQLGHRAGRHADAFGSRNVPPCTMNCRPVEPTPSPAADAVAFVIILEHTGAARLGRRTKDLVKRLRPDDIAIIDHADLDRVSAEELAESGVRVVVNVAPSSTGRFPNPGPLELVRTGVCLIDVPGRTCSSRSPTASFCHRPRRQPVPQRDRLARGPRFQRQSSRPRSQSNGRG